MTRSNWSLYVPGLGWSLAVAYDEIGQFQSSPFGRSEIPDRSSLLPVRAFGMFGYKARKLLFAAFDGQLEIESDGCQGAGLGHHLHG